MDIEYPIVVPLGRVSIWSYDRNMMVHGKGTVGMVPHWPTEDDREALVKGIDNTIKLCEYTLAEMKIAKKILGY